MSMRHSSRYLITALSLLLAHCLDGMLPLHAQPSPQHEPQRTRVEQSDSIERDDSTGLYTRIRLSSITANSTFLPLTLTETMSSRFMVLSFDALIDLDIYSIRSASEWRSSAIGIRFGVGVIFLPLRNVSSYLAEKYGPIGAEDMDLLFRYAIYTSHFRSDLLLGLTVRTGTYHDDDGRPSYEPPAIDHHRNAALKFGIDVSFDLWNPVLSAHFRAGCVLFGYETIEPSYLGIGISLGYQRYFHKSY